MTIILNWLNRNSIWILIGIGVVTVATSLAVMTGLGILITIKSLQVPQ